MICVLLPWFNMIFIYVRLRLSIIDNENFQAYDLQLIFKILSIPFSWIYLVIPTKRKILVYFYHYKQIQNKSNHCLLTKIIITAFSSTMDAKMIRPLWISLIWSWDKFIIPFETIVTNKGFYDWPFVSQK